MIRIGCLGAARIAPPALVHPARCRGDVALTVIAARDRSRAEAFATEHGFDRVADAYEAVIMADDVDLVYNPLPIHRHARWSLRALEAGKHVLCEKPLAMNTDEVRAMQAACDRSGTRLIEAFHYRYHPMFAHYLRWIDEQAIGTLRRIDAEFNAPIDDNGGTEIRHLPETGGGAFMDLGCYPLSWTLMTVVDRPAEIAATASLTSRGVDERMAATLTFPGGVVAQLHSSMAPDTAHSFRLEVTGDDGVIRFVNPLAPQLGARLTLENRAGHFEAPLDRVTTYFYQLDAVVRSLRDGSVLPTEGEILVRQQSCLDAIYAAAGLAHLRESV